MPSSGDVASTVLVDTSAAVPYVLEDHEAHQLVVAELAGLRLGLGGHAAYETFAVLTRLPPPARCSPATAARVIASNFPATVQLGSAAAKRLARSLSTLGVAGGAVFDALVGAAAQEHDLTLATRDQRAVRTYRALDIRVRMLA